MILLVFCLFLSAFFSSSETALMSVNKIKIRQMVDEGVPHARLLSRLLEDPQRLLSAILVGNNVVNIAASALATSLAIGYFGNAGVGIATGIMTLIVLIFSEITPKSLASIRADKIALLVIRPIHVITVFLRPIIFVLSGITRGLLHLLGAAEQDQPNVTEEELRTMMDVSHEEGVIEQDERRLLENVFEFGDAQVRDIMIARTDVTAVEVDATYDEILETFRTERVSRIPVYEDDMDDMIGILHIKDFFLFDKAKTEFSLRGTMRKAHYTIESKRIADLFEEMRSKRQQMAIVVDEYGGTAGIITMQDIVEIIFGDIDDEYDDAGEIIRKVSDDEYWVEGALRLKDLNELMQVSLDSEDFDTIGGLITGELGRLPRQGDQLTIDGLLCQVLEADRNRVTLLSVTRQMAPEKESLQTAAV
ncbi:MAG: hemolysin family protein [Eubacteriales bacterium]|nr:hemolysin family protein [Eubacteriales bacterium]